MNPQSPDVDSLAEHVGSCLGEACRGTELVAHRRGSRVYRLHFPTGDIALKLATHNCDEQGVREAEHLARREAGVLTHLHDFIPGYLIVAGDLDPGGSWLALRWLDGVTPHRLLAPARHGDDSPAQREAILDAAVNIADRLAALHALGWLHADLQPAHILFGSSTVHLIDFALAQGPHPFPSEVTYRGGMVHFTAPETAARILATPDDQPITINEPAEVYALAAVLHLAWTGLPPVSYTDDHAPWRDKLKDVAHGRHHDPETIRPWPWPAFEDALRHALTPEPENRIPLMATFRDAVSGVRQDIGGPD
ncbi:MAG: protein kinase domain-containing protein [Pseudonocardia sp.]